MSSSHKEISLQLGTPLSPFTCNIHGNPCLSAGKCDGYHSLPKKEVHNFDKSNQESSWNRHDISSWLPGARLADKPRGLWTTILYSTRTHHLWANRSSTEKTNTCVYLWFHTTYPSIKLDKPLEYAVYSTILTLWVSDFTWTCFVAKCLLTFYVECIVCLVGKTSFLTWLMTYHISAWQIKY